MYHVQVPRWEGGIGWVLVLVLHCCQVVGEVQASVGLIWMTAEAECRQSEKEESRRL